MRGGSSGGGWASQTGPQILLQNKDLATAMVCRT